MKKKKTKSIRSRLTSQFIFLLVLITIVFTMVLFASQLLKRLDNNSSQILIEQVTNKGQELSYELTNMTFNTIQLSERLSYELERELISNKNISILSLIENDKNALDKGIQITTSTLIDFLHATDIPSVFVLFESSYYEENPNNKTAIFIRDNQPEILDKENKNLLLTRGPLFLQEEFNLKLDKNWKADFSLKETANNKFSKNFYTYPLEAEKDFSTQNVNILEFCGYWSPQQKMTDHSPKVLTYSLPLIDHKGETFGVLGIEITNEILEKLLTVNKLVYENSFYALGIKKDDYILRDSLIISDLYSEYILSNLEEEIPLNKPLKEFKEEIRPFTDIENNKYLSYLDTIPLYDKISPFSVEEWVIMGMVPEDNILSSSNLVLYIWLLTSILSILVGIVASFIFSKIFTNDIISLASQVNALSPYDDIHIEKTYIEELDVLGETITEFGQDIKNSSIRLSQIVDMVGTRIGGFEFAKKHSKVYITDSLFTLLNLDKTKDQLISKEMFFNFFPSNTVDWKNNEDETIIEFHSTCEETKDIKYLKIRHRNENDITRGVVLDATDEVFKKEQVDYESQYDLLTGLLNRNSYKEIMAQFLYNDPLSIELLFLEILTI